MYFSKTTKWFYSEVVSGSNIPPDAVYISDEVHQNLLTELSNGKVLDADEQGYPIAVEKILSQTELNQLGFENIKNGLQREIDIQAQSLGFSSGNSLILYAGFTNPFQSLALQFASWESSVWVAAEHYKQEVLAGTKPLPTIDEAVAMMTPYIH